MKSGPHLNGCTIKPRARNAAISPSATVVFPAPLDEPATTNARHVRGPLIAVARVNYDPSRYFTMNAAPINGYPFFS